MRHPGLLVIGCALGMSVSCSTIYFATFSVFLTPVANAFGWTRGGLSTLFAANNVAIAVATPVMGWLVKRFGVRRVLTFSTLGFSASIAGFSLAPGHFALFMALSISAGVFGAGTNTFVYVSVLPQWFSKRLGLAFGLAMTGIGIGQALMPIVAQMLISRFGWREAYAGLALFPLLIGLPCVAFLIRERDTGGRERVSKEIDRTEGSYAFLNSPRFWLFSLTFLLITAVVAGITVHTVPILLDRGFTPMAAASFAATTGMALMVGRLISGALLDYVGTRTVATIVFVGAAIGAAILAWGEASSLLVFVPILLGVALGAEGDLMPFAVRRYYGLKNYPVIYSSVFAFFGVGAVIGPIAMGMAFDLTGGYGTMLPVLCAAALLAVPAFWLATSGSGKTEDFAGQQLGKAT